MGLVADAGFAFYVVNESSREGRQMIAVSLLKSTLNALRDDVIVMRTVRVLVFRLALCSVRCDAPQYFVKF